MLDAIDVLRQSVLYNSSHGSKLQGLAELFVEVIVVVVLLGNSSKRVEAVLHKILFDPAQDFHLL